MADISQVKLPNNQTYNIKDNSQVRSNHRHYYTDLIPTISKTYASTAYYATSAGDWNTSSWYFMSVKPDSWYKPWSVKFKIRSFCPSYSNVDSVTWSTISGREQSVIYANWNEKYDTAHYYIPIYPLKKAGFDAGYGHAIGISILYGTNYTNSAYYRTFEIDYYQCENCTVTILDTPVKWANWTGTGTTNYGGLSGLDAVNRGLRESGDDNDTGYYVRRIYPNMLVGSNKVFPYTMIMQNSDGRWESIVTSSSTGTSKAVNTHGFRLNNVLLMYANATYNENNSLPTYNIWSMHSGLIDHRYSFNTANDSTNGTTGYKPVYLVGSINATDGLFYLNSTKWWTQTLPTSADGKLYIYIGDAYDYYRMTFVDTQKIYWYIDGKVQEYAQSSGYATSAPWSGISGKPSTYPPSSHNHSQIVTVGDQRSTATTPNDYGNNIIFKGLKIASVIGSPGGGSYAYLVGLRGWSDSSGGNSHEFAFTDSGVFRRQGATTTWGSWMKLLDSTNYTDYTVTKTGTGASGTWGINITGTSAKASKANLTTTQYGIAFYSATDGTFGNNPCLITTSTGGLEVKGIIAGDTGSTGHGLYGGGGYHNAYNNILLHGDASTGSSGIAFVSDKITASTGVVTNVNQPSDRAFIQYHACGITTATAEGTNPTLATSGESGKFVIGIGNDADDQIWLQTPGRTGLIHQVGTGSYTIPDTGNTTGNVGSGTQPVYVSGGVITATTYSLGKSVPSDAKFTDTTYSAGTGLSLSGTTFSVNNATISPYEAKLQWGGGNTAGSVTPIGMSLSNEHNCNRLAFINGSCLTFEYSSDGGTNYTDYGYSATQKSAWCTTSLGVPVGRADSASGSSVTTSSRTRVTLTATNTTTQFVYTNPKKMLINVTNAQSLRVLVEYRTGTNYKSGGAWSTFGTYGLSGWSGWNDIPLILGTLGGGTTQTGNNWQLRLTFEVTSVSSSSPSVCSINAIRIYGENAWITPSTMATTGHIYTFDMSQNAFFPRLVQANYLAVKGTTAATSTYADTNPKIYFQNSDGSQNISLTYSDYDSVQSPASLTLNGTQGGEYFIAPNIKATGSFYGNLSGNATTATSATKATQDESSNNIKATYSASMDKIDHRLRLMNKNGSVLSTINITHSEPSASGDMNDAAAYGNSMGMINLSGTDTKINPNGQTGWHHFINISYTIASQSSNMWQTQIANKAGTTDLWIRSRSGGAIDDATAWPAAWTRILTGSNWSNVITKSAIGLGNVENKSSATIRSEITSSNVTTALGYTPPTSDTNTHRPIQMNGTEILGNNTTALNLKAGSNVTLTNSSGTVTIAATDTNTWRPIGTGATDAAAGNHTHGNIQNGGTLQTNDITIASGDKLVVTDSSDSAKVARTSISFDGSTATKCLTQKGTWETFTNNAGTITGSGTSGYIAKWNGGSSITNGPAFGTATTTYLRNDGSWATPTDTNYYHTTGSWNGLTYTATANGGAGALAFTIPTGTTATTVAAGNHTHSSYLPLSGGTITGTVYSKTSGVNFEVWDTNNNQKLRFTATDTPRAGIYDIVGSKWLIWKDEVGRYRIGSNGYPVQVFNQAKGTTTYNFAHGVVVAYRTGAASSNGTVAYVSQWADAVIYQHHVSTINVSVSDTNSKIQIANNTSANIQVILIGCYYDNLG